MTGLGRRRRFAFIAAALIGLPLAVLLGIVGLASALALSDLSIDASRWRDVAAQRASAALGPPVILQGAFEIEPRLGRELRLRVGALQVLDPNGCSKPEFLAIGELRANVDLFDALRGRLRASRIEATAPRCARTRCAPRPVEPHRAGCYFETVSLSTTMSSTYKYLDASAGT